MYILVTEDVKMFELNDQEDQMKGARKGESYKQEQDFSIF